MALILSEEQQMLRDSARSFLQESSPVSALRERRDSDEDWSPELWAGMGEMGWTGIAIPEDHGGLDFGFVGAGLVFEECGRVLTASPLLSSSMVCASLILELGTDEQKAVLLGAIAAGETVVTLALSETGRFDPQSIALSASASANGDSFILDGRKCHVLDAAIADHFIVVARSSGEANAEDDFGLFLVDRDAGGVSVETSLNVDARQVGTVRFESVQVESSARLGKAGGSRDALEKALDIGAVLSAAELLGLSQEAFERTLDYLKERKQFGVAIGTFQVLQHRAAQLFCELELSKSIVLKALQAIDEDSEERALLASIAKAKAAKTAKLAVSESVQMHGGIGMTDEFDIGFFMKRSAAASQEYGDYYYHADRLAKLRGY